MPEYWPLIMAGVIFFAVLGIITAASQVQNLDGIKSKTVGDGQHGTARWATRAEIRSTYVRVPFTPEKWRKQAAQGTQPSDAKNHALPQGIVVGCEGNTTALIDPGDVHVLMIGAAGVGKTAFWLYPCIEHACASGMSFLSTDTKGDVMRNYGNIAAGYGYNVSVIDLRNPTRSHGNNLLHLVNKYMDLYKEHSDVLLYKAKAEKYAKIIAKTIIQSGTDSGNMGQNAYFYDAAEGLLTATILLVSEFCEPEKRHIVSVYKIIQELLAPSKEKGKNQFQQQMMERPLMTPDELKSLPKGDFIVMKTGTHPMRVHLKLFFKWGITFDEDKPYTVPERGNRMVQYAEKKELLNAIICKYRPDLLKESVDECMASHDRTEGIKTTGNGNQSHGCEIHQANEEKGKAGRQTGSKVVRTTAPANRVANPVSPTVQRASAQEGMENA